MLDIPPEYDDDDPTATGPCAICGAPLEDHHLQEVAQKCSEVYIANMESDPPGETPPDAPY